MQHDLDETMSRPVGGQGNRMMKWIQSQQFLFGILLAVVLAGGIIVIDTWFPWIEQGLHRHERVEDAVSLTAFFLVVCVYYFWRWHRRRGFWTALCIFFVLHVAGVLIYSVYFHPLILWQWSVLGIFEGYAAALFVGFWTSRQARREAMGWWHRLWN